MTIATHDKISPTAKLVAFLRTFTDIPFSVEIAEACDAQKVFSQLVGGNPRDFLWMAPLIEMRYKSVDVLLKHFGTDNIVEIASGVSPRGLIWTSNSKYSFFETDLPEILAEKKDIVSGILESRVRGKLLWHPLNAVNEDDFSKIEQFFDGQPVSFINEGLLPYLNHDEKGKVARSIHQILKKYGGVWITPDISSNGRLKELVDLDPNMGRVIQTISGRTGRDLQNNSFASLEIAVKFFEDIGFKTTQYDQSSLVPRLTSLEEIEVDPKKLDVILDHGKIWVLEPR